MKILIYAPYAINTPHFETELEIAQLHLDAGDEVVLLGCNANLLACDVNLYHYITVCLNCIGRRRAGIKLLSSKIELKPLYFLMKQNKEEINRLRTGFSTISELKEFKVENFDIGYGVLSSIVSATREPDVDLVVYNDLLKRYLISSLAVYRSVQNYLSLYTFDRVYVYNGRYAHMRAAFRACQSRNVECILHERGSRITRYALYKNATPHDLVYVNEMIKEVWSSDDIANRGEKASQFYLDRYNNISHTWIAHTKDQQKDLLPEGWDDTKINVAIFISSEDEFEAIGDTWKNPIYDSQFEGITKILDSTRGNDRLQFYLRVHPNLRNVKSKQIEQLESLKSPHLTIIPADSPISTYALLRRASKVVTFGSTVGIEAVYWGIPSILAGPCFYRELGSTYNPKNHEELVEMLYSDLRPKNKEGALMYGYYLNTFGIDFKYYESKGIYEGLFKGVQVRPTRLVGFLTNMLGWASVLKLPNLVRWLSLRNDCKKMGIPFGKIC